MIRYIMYNFFFLPSSVKFAQIRVKSIKIVHANFSSGWFFLYVNPGNFNGLEWTEMDELLSARVSNIQSWFQQGIIYCLGFIVYKR